MNIKEIKELCAQSKIKWSGHASGRIQQRGISREDVINCIMGGEIIEEYPEYWLNPTCLIFGYSVDNKIIHVVVGLDNYVHIVTAYFPSEAKFEPDMKTRKGVLIMCFYCKGDMKPSTTTHVVNYGSCLIVIKNVPCEECDQCGEIEYSDEVMQKLEMIVNDAKKLLQEFSIIDYAKVA